MDYSNKRLDALIKTNTILKNKIDEMVNNIIDSDSNSIICTELNHRVIYENHNNETSYILCNISKGEKTHKITEKEFKRLICLQGKINIHIPAFNEKTTLISLNNILIPPNTEYSIEVIEDAQVMCIYKPRKETREKILEDNSIYKKVLKNE